MRMNPPTLDPDSRPSIRHDPVRPLAYIAGPIFGVDPVERDQKFEAGRLLASYYGFDSIIPTELETPDHSGICPPGRQSDDDRHSETCKLKADFKVLLDCDALILLPGWPRSWGSKLELQIASAVGLAVYTAHLPTGHFSIGKLEPQNDR